jgi:hypothetical protein
LQKRHTSQIVEEKEQEKALKILSEQQLLKAKNSKFLQMTIYHSKYLERLGVSKNGR